MYLIVYDDRTNKPASERVNSLSKAFTLSEMRPGMIYETQVRDGRELARRIA